MFVYFIVGAVATYFFDAKSANYGLFITGVGQLLILLAPLFLFVKASPLSKEEIFRLKKKMHIEYLLLGIAAVIIIQFLNTATIIVQEALLPPGFRDTYFIWKQTVEELYSGIFKAATFYQIVIIFIIGAIVPAFSEELLFRGFLQRHLEEKLKPLKAILITAAIFALIHFNMVYIIPLFFIGTILGTSAYTSGSIKLPILIHLINNGLAIIVYQYQDQIQETDKLMPLWLASFILISCIALLGAIIYLMFMFKKKEDSKKEETIA
jgi:membrane protease YdiL (CAAX protease family)